MRWYSLLAGMGFIAMCAWAAVPEEQSASWGKVKAAMDQGQPKTAIAALEPIIKTAKEQKKWGEAIRGIAQKIALEGSIEGNKPEEKIVRMKAAIEASPIEMQPVMHAILAHWHWHFFQHNRGRFMQRTQVAQPGGDDIATWDLPRILHEIDVQFETALKDSETLQKIPVAQFADLLEAGTLPDRYRPTLYDIVAQSALQFYAAGEQAGNEAEDAFEVSADSPIFAGRDEFMKWEPGSAEDKSPKLQAIRLYQKLLKFHADDQDKSARLDADLDRLEFGKNYAIGEEKEERYIAALQRIREGNSDHELSSKAAAMIAQQMFDDSDWVSAREMALEGQKKFPESVGAKLCYNIVLQIEAPECDVQCERVWNSPLTEITVRYRNVERVYFRAIAFDFDQWLAKPTSYSPHNLSTNERQALLKKKPALTWDAPLPKSEDYQLRNEKLKAPPSLKPGSYYLVASHKPDFGDANNQVSVHDFWVSDLAVVVRTENGSREPGTDGFVLNALSGEPLAGAEVRVYARGRREKAERESTVKTDENGYFKFRGKDPEPYRTQYFLDVVHPVGRLSTASNFWVPQVRQPETDQESTLFFTDRAIYRPGQTIQYKGISYFSNLDRNEYRVVKKRAVKVVFSDVNGKEIERQSHVTNDYGSFSGSFTAPRDRLMGSMSIRVEEGPGGSTQVTVEEYKRPKFQVEIDAPKDAPKLNEVVSIEGTATAYTGAAIDRAKVRWRVVRQVRYPIWWYWRFWFLPQPSSEGKEIARGTATTDEQGKFKLEFKAIPDRSVSEDDEPTFHYAISADVIDNTGETRSDETSVPVGYASIKAELSAENWLVNDKPVEVKVQTSSLDGKGQGAKGELKIYRLKEPDKVQRANFEMPNDPPRPFKNRRYQKGRVVRIVPPRPTPQPSNVNSWELGEEVHHEMIETDGSGKQSVKVKLDVGAYRAKLESTDRFGKQVTAELPLIVIDPEADRLAIKVPDLFQIEKPSLEPGNQLNAVWGTGYESGRAFVEIEHRGDVHRSYWTKPGITQTQITEKIKDAYRGGFQVRVTFVRENRAYFHQHRVEVPWNNKELKLKWEHFVSKLEPGSKEKWTAVVSGPDAEGAAAELVATLYDASLDQFLELNWVERFQVFYQDYSNVNPQFQNMPVELVHVLGSYNRKPKDASYSYRRIPESLVVTPWFYGYGIRRFARGGAMAKGVEVEMLAAPMAAAPVASMATSEDALGGLEGAKGLNAAANIASASGGGTAGAKKPDLNQVTARKNLQETAFFFPKLISQSNGEVRLEFQMPEALTEWKFLGFAHDQELRSGFFKDKTITAKEIMVQPNPPRFLREGDTLSLTAKISNLSATRQSGSVRLSLFDARTGDPIESKFGLDELEQSFDVASKASQGVSWSLKVPEESGVIQYRIVGSTGRLSDGEEGYLPVLSRRILVTESMTLPIRDAKTKTFEMEKLLKSGDSKTLKHQALTVQMVSNPSWYAVMALPYLMEYPYDCSEQTFNRLYANLLARHIAQSDPKIHRVFEQWRGTKTLDSPLMQNQDLKSVMIEETPWLREAEAESQQRRNVGILFDDNRMEAEIDRLQQKVAEMQLPDGLWSWFPGGPENKYISLYIATGYARLRHLGVAVDMGPALRSIQQLDMWADEEYRQRLKAKDPEGNHLSSTAALYLYCRSFYLKDVEVQPQYREAVDYWRKQAREHWLKLPIRQSQAHLALALHRWDDRETAKLIMRSIKERSVNQEEMGMFWRETELSWWWYHAPIETQAMMIEAFDEVMDDREAVEDCKVWLLKQKQTRDWRTTKGTADAVYSLLLRGTNQLASNEIVEVALGGEVIKPEDVEAGTGFYETRLTRGEIKPEQGEVRVTKSDPGVAWGSVHWQYLEDMSKVTPYEGTPLQLKKGLFVKENTKTGPVLKPVEGIVAVGDELVVRVELRVDRDMEYVHLKDYRGAGTEPVNVLSRYRFQDGLAYYESTRDTASHFFIDYLPKGVYVFEYSTRVQHRGKYQTGVAEIQCMYAPEFNSHSESVWLEVE